MELIIFISILALVFALVLYWACTTLPGERWQVLATIPLKKNGSGEWHGLNITFYGFFQAGSFMLAFLMMILMLGSIGVTFWGAMLLLMPIVLICLPASRWIARIVEKKPQTLTVGGASFLGMIMAPWIALAAAKIFHLIPGGCSGVLPALAAIAISYSFGEGFGRMACISFGCCYGKPLCDCNPLLQKVFKHNAFVFTGETKKITYESRLDGQPVVPIQAVTSAVYLSVGLISLYLWFSGFFGTSLLLALTVTQGWRAVSELFRADYRGGGKISAYQKMAILTIVNGVFIMFLFPVREGMTPVLANGAASLWNPLVLLVAQGLWFAVLYYTGRSKVTGSTIRFHIIQGQI